MKKLSLILSILLSVFVSSCGNKEFSIEGEFDDEVTQNMRFVYATADGVTSQWVPAVKGKVEMKGRSQELTVVYIFNAQSKFLSHIVIKNGESVTLRGKLSDPYSITSEGTELNDEWASFLAAQRDNLKAGKAEKVDKAIESYIKANPGSIVSTLLLTCDYSAIESAKARKLLESISDEAKPESLLALYGSTLRSDSASSKPLTPFSIRNDKDSLVLFNPKTDKINILYFWYNGIASAEPDTVRTHIIKELKELSKKKDVTISDIYINVDTARWYMTVSKDSVKWEHYKALTGHYDAGISDMNIVGENYLIVCDSTGKQIYRGALVDKAKAAVNRLSEKK